jgi:hypothetical protein
VTDEPPARLGRTSTPSGCPPGLATLIRYLSNHTHWLRMLPFVDDKSDDVGTFISQGLGHQSYSPTSDQAIRNALEKTWSPRERAKMYALGMPGSPGILAISKAKDAPAWQKAAARWWMEQGPAITS